MAGSPSSKRPEQASARADMPSNGKLQSMIRRLTPVLVSATVAALVPLGHAQAQWLPDKTVRTVVPFAPGGAADMLARVITQQITRSTGQQTLVENRPGGGTVPATEAVARASPDGATLLLLANSFVINPSLRPSLPYQPLTSFEPICHLAYAPTVVAVHRSSPYMKLAELLEAAKPPQARITMAGVGPATSVHISIEMLNRAARTNLVYVPFPGGTPAVTNLLGGHVTSAIANYSEVQGNLGGDLRPLAIGADKRLAAHPEVPTLAEAGFAEIDATTWFGLSAPARTPRAVVDQITAAVQAALAAREVRERMEAVGLFPAGTCGGQFASFLARQHDMFARAIKESGIKAE